MKTSRKRIFTYLILILLTSLSCNTKKEKEVQQPKDIAILVTSDTHCEFENGFGYSGLTEIKNQLIEKGYEVILVDCGDSYKKSETISDKQMIQNMNEMGYMVAIPGNHEFDYGVDRFLKMTKKADFPYICCNLERDDKLVLEPYKILDVEGKKIAFIGAIRPMSFSVEEDELKYKITGRDKIDNLYNAIQSNVDEVKDNGADSVILLGHIGINQDIPYKVLANTSGIDVLFDGHSHDEEVHTLKNKDNVDVTRIAVGKDMNGIGYLFINSDGTIKDMGAWYWNDGSGFPVFED